MLTQDGTRREAEGMKGVEAMLKAGRTLLFAAVVALGLGLLPMLAGAGACNSSSSSTRFYVPPPDKGAVQQMVSLVKKHDFKDAVLLAKMVSKGHAVWLNGGTPTDVKKQVKQTMVLAKVQHAVPVFSVYNIPGRDCAGYSQGGALNATDYANWIDGVARPRHR
jgi:endoglucanase